ncbi:tetratricopeptide repeat protein [Halarcobacter sp.]|uniref:tetratricopeptide repeat protein n=1 Tax=Halarcobacter sp. TaxID=2321133 RepID=UPI003A94D539
MKYLILTILITSFAFSLSFEEVKKIEEEQGVLKALSSYRVLAKRDDTQSIYRLATLYLKGKGVQKSISTAKTFLEQGSLLNHHKSTYLLGKLYITKKSPYFNEKLAFNTFLKAANDGYAPAQNMIGQFLAAGIAVEKDYKLAIKYFEYASKQGHEDAHCNLAFMYANGKGAFPNFGRAHQFAKEGVKKGNKKCIKVWETYNLEKYDQDKGWKFNFYTKPSS